MLAEFPRRGRNIIQIYKEIRGSALFRQLDKEPHARGIWGSDHIMMWDTNTDRTTGLLPVSPVCADTYNARLIHPIVRNLTAQSLKNISRRAKFD